RNLVVLRHNQPNPFSAGTVGIEVNHDLAGFFTFTYSHECANRQFVLPVKLVQTKHVTVFFDHPAGVFLTILTINQGDIGSLSALGSGKYLSGGRVEWERANPAVRVNQGDNAFAPGCLRSFRRRKFVIQFPFEFEQFRAKQGTVVFDRCELQDFRRLLNFSRFEPGEIPPDHAFRPHLVEAIIVFEDIVEGKFLKRLRAAFEAAHFAEDSGGTQRTASIYVQYRLGKMQMSDIDL